MSSSPQQGQTIELASLSAQQLSSIKKQLDEELEHLTTSFTQLRAAQVKFKECLRSIDKGLRNAPAGRDKGQVNEILVPLTTSLYVPGKLADSETVIVDIGTGFYVEKSIGDATKFYNKKVDELEANLKDLDKIIKGKSENLRVIEDALRQKVINASSNPAASSVA